MPFVIVALFILCSLPGFAGAQQRPTENLAQLVAGALANNPELKASDAKWRMFRERIPLARSLEDPMLMLKLQNGVVTDPFNFSRDSMTQKVIGVSQLFPFPGKRKLREEMAVQEAESYRHSLAERRLELTRMVKESYYQLYFTDKSLEILDKNLRIIDDFVTMAQTRYTVGQGVQQDILKSQLERSRMLDMQIGLKQQRRSQEVALNTLLARPKDTPVGVVADFQLSPLKYDARQLMELAEQNRPLLKGLRAELEKGRAGHELARKEYYPDFNVSVEYMQRDAAMGSDGADMYSIGVTFHLPVTHARHHAMQAETAAGVTMAGEELNGARNTISSGIADLLAQMQRRQELVELYRTGIIPLAEQSLESAVISYRVNKVDFLSLLDNRTILFNYEKEYYDSLADYQMKLAQLEALVGQELQSGEAHPSGPTALTPAPLPEGEGRETDHHEHEKRPR